MARNNQKAWKPEKSFELITTPLKFNYHYWVRLNKRHQSPIGLQGVARRKLRLDRLLTLPVLRHSMNTGKIGLFDKKKDSNVRHFHLIFLIV
jgi:hypothetical protein